MKERKKVRKKRRVTYFLFDRRLNVMCMQWKWSCIYRIKKIRNRDNRMKQEKNCICILLISCGWFWLVNESASDSKHFSLVQAFHTVWRLNNEWIKLYHHLVNIPFLQIKRQDIIEVVPLFACLGPRCTEETISSVAICISTTARRTLSNGILSLWDVEIWHLVPEKLSAPLDRVRHAVFGIQIAKL